MREFFILLAAIGAVVFAFWVQSERIDGLKRDVMTITAEREEARAQARVNEAVAVQTDVAAVRERVIVREVAREREAFPLIVNDDARLLGELNASLARVLDAAAAEPADDRPHRASARPDAARA